MPLSPHASSFTVCHATAAWRTTDKRCIGGGDREDVALSYVYANSGCVAASWLCVL